ncbi:MAG: MerR family transcriptional regulator [Nitrospinaceae bacterium]|nr:MAG: MerR family transcriptional regulator [Nitrospinaceae bacterium]
MKTFRINQVARITGLSKEVLRVWEKRYRLLSPERGPNRYRLYNEQDIDLLKFLVEEIKQGQSIGELASLGKDEILARVREKGKKEPESLPRDQILVELEKYLLPLDPLAFEKRLNDLMVLSPFEEVFKRILVPLQIRVGELWFEDKLDISIEHYVTAQVKQKLFTAINMIGIEQHGPKVLIACPPWELHEIGAQMIAYFCATRKGRVIFLGANLPLANLIHFCSQTKPDVVILSCTSDISENKARAFFTELSHKISTHKCPVWVGGQGIRSVEPAFEKAKIKIVNGLEDLEKLLGELASRQLF